MNTGPRRIRLAATAQNDIRAIRSWTRRQFGQRQADTYAAGLARLLARLAEAPDLRGSILRDEFDPPLRSLHLATVLPRARHLVLYRSQPERTIVVLRVLHDAMELSGKLPGA